MSPLYQISLIAVIVALKSLYSQPLHQNLLYSHPLTDATPRADEQIENISGNFISGRGWQAISENSQLRIELAATLPFEGTFTIDVTNFDPASQSVPDLKQQIINLYSRIYNNNKDIFPTNGSWWNIRTGTNYSSGSGMAGFKFLAAPRGIDTREELRCIEDATWDLNRVYKFKVIWTTSQIYCLLDGVVMATFNFQGQIEPFKYILIGKDNLIWGYCAQPGPIYSNIRIFGPGSTPEDRTPPRVLCSTLETTELFKIVFDEPVDGVTALNVNNYLITPSINISSIELDSTQQKLEIHTTNHTIGQTYSLEMSGVADTSVNHNLLDTTIVYEYPIELIISAISKSNYYLAEKIVGDSVYSDRSYKITSIPASLEGYNWIVTANDDKQDNSDSFLTFCINKPAFIVIGYDTTDASVPPWLQTWTSIGSTIQTEDAVFACYQKPHVPCEITLGGNYGSSSSSMYVILVDDTFTDTTPPQPPTGLKVVQF